MYMLPQIQYDKVLLGKLKSTFKYTKKKGKR